MFNTSFRWGWPLSAINLKASHSAFESENSGDRGRVEITVVYGRWLTSIPKVKERKKRSYKKACWFDLMLTAYISIPQKEKKKKIYSFQKIRKNSWAGYAGSGLNGLHKLSVSRDNFSFPSLIKVRLHVCLSFWLCHCIIKRLTNRVSLFIKNINEVYDVNNRAGDTV